jgi:ferredoxin-NADP reductase
VAAVAAETAAVRTITLEVPDWAGHHAGQHLDVRLTAEDGYRAERSYSIASAPGEQVAITVERLTDGEVSPYLTEELRPGDQIEIRGPIGGYFVWDGRESPLLLVAGGSGVVPFRSMLRQHRLISSTAAIKLLYSARARQDVIYRAELDDNRPGIEVIYTFTRQPPPGWTGRVGRVDDTMLTEVSWPADAQPLVFVCGPTAFVVAVAGAMVRLGYPPERVKTERFGGMGES